MCSKTCLSPNAKVDVGRWRGKCSISSLRAAQVEVTEKSASHHLDDNFCNRYCRQCFHALREAFPTISRRFWEFATNVKNRQKIDIFNFRKRIGTRVRGGPPGLKLRQEIPQDISSNPFFQISWMCSKTCLKSNSKVDYGCSRGKWLIFPFGAVKGRWPRRVLRTNWSATLRWGCLEAPGTISDRFWIFEKMSKIIKNWHFQFQKMDLDWHPRWSPEAGNKTGDSSRLVAPPH